MDKDGLVRIAQTLWETTLEANSYYAIIEQINSIGMKYLDEMNYSPAFYTFVDMALRKALFMELAKLYDESKSALNIKELLNHCKNNKSLFSIHREIQYIYEDGIKRELNYRYRHQLKKSEECIINERVKGEVEKHRRSALFILGLTDDLPVVEFTLEEYLELLIKKLRTLNKKRKNLTVLRNKKYAHTDKETIHNVDDLYKNNPISSQNVQELLDFSFQVSSFVIESLTGSNVPKKYSNIGDWENTLILTRLGVEYEEIQGKIKNSKVDSDMLLHMNSAKEQTDK